MPANLTATYAPAEITADSGVGVVLEADVLAPVQRYAKLDDVEQMLARARSGLSAQTYVSPECPARFFTDGSVLADCGFTAWPCPVDLAYSIEASAGELGEAERVAVDKSFDLVDAYAERLTLPAIMAPLVITWQTPCYTEFGYPAAAPAITVEGRDLVFSAKVFGVLRISGLAHGDHYILVLKIALAQAVGAIPVIDPAGFDMDAKAASTVTAAWADPAGIPGHAILELTPPECVNDMTDTCPDGAPTGTGGSTGITVGVPEEVPVVYYSICTGEVLELRYE